MADTSIKLSGTYDSIEAYRILEEMRGMSEDYEDIKEEAEAASSAATAAVATANAAVTNATTAATNASTYADNANTSATAAAGSASTAATAADNALDSETAAASSASAASTSETNAAASETAAAASEAAAAAALAVIEAKYAQAILAAHPVGSFYESTDSTSPATLFGGTWQEQIPDGELIGSIAAFAGSSLPSGWLLCDGSAISRTTYSALFDAVGTTYGSGDGSTSFNVPDLVDKFIEGAATAGTVKAAGLPNISGRIQSRSMINDSNFTAQVPSGGGAFSNGSYATGDYSAGHVSTNVRKLNIEFDASRSSSIYGNSSTVQPPALTMRYAIYTGNVGKHCWLRQS